MPDFARLLQKINYFCMCDFYTDKILIIYAQHLSPDQNQKLIHTRSFPLNGKVTECFITLYKLAVHANKRANKRKRRFCDLAFLMSAWPVCVC